MIPYKHHLTKQALFMYFYKDSAFYKKCSLSVL